LGAQLGLKQYHLASISVDNAYNPNRTEGCCKVVLAKWLKIDPSPTWGKLEDAVNIIGGFSINDDNIITGAYCLV